VPADRVERAAFILGLPDKFKEMFNYTDGFWIKATTKMLVEDELYKYVRAGN